MGLILGAVAGFAIAVLKRTMFDLKGTKGAVKMLSKKRNGDAVFAGGAVVLIVVVLALWGTNRLG